MKRLAFLLISMGVSTISCGGGGRTINTATPSAAVCGNAAIETGEQCDDGNTTSGDGCSSTCAVEAAPNQPPTANASANDFIGLAPFAVQFAGSGSDPDGTIASYSWSFGDGQSSPLRNPQHTYSTAGVFTATLTVTDNDGDSDQASVQIQSTCGLSGLGLCIGHASKAAGEAASIPVKLLNAQAVAGSTLTIVYNQNLLTASAPTNGNLISGLFVPNVNVPGEIRVAIAGAEGFTGSGDLLTLNFSIKSGAAKGLTSVSFASSELSGIDGSVFEGAATSNGSITVQ